MVFALTRNYLLSFSGSCFWNFPRRCPQYFFLNISWRADFWFPSWEEDEGIPWNGIDKSETMLPQKLLMYRRSISDINLETLRENRRRKKSGGDLYHHGYRVKKGYHARENKEDQTGLCYSVRSYLSILSNWGKGVRFSGYTYIVCFYDSLNPDLEVESWMEGGWSVWWQACGCCLIFRGSKAHHFLATQTDTHRNRAHTRLYGISRVT